MGLLHERLIAMGQEIAKRPVNAYSMWLSDNRAKIMEEHKIKAVTEVAKKGGELWKALPDAEKKPYEEKYAEAKAKWDKVKEAEKAEMDARLNPEGSMKKPQTSYFLWFNENRIKIQEEHKTKGFGETTKKAAELWKTLSDADKKPFEDKAMAAKKAYEEYKTSAEGKAILEKQKEAKQELKGAKDAKQKKKTAKKEGGDDGDESGESSSPTKDEPKCDAAEKAKKTPREAAEKAEKPTRKRGGAKAEKPPVEKKAKVVKVVPRKGLVSELSAAMQEKCKSLGLTPNSVPYDLMLAKLLATPELNNLDEEKALSVLQKNGGLLNKARNELKED